MSLLILIILLFTHDGHAAHYLVEPRWSLLNDKRMIGTLTDGQASTCQSMVKMGCFMTKQRGES